MGARDEQAPGGVLGALRRLRRRVSARRTPEEIPELLHRPPDLIPGVAGRGEALAAGVYDFGGQVVRAGDVGEQGETPWRHTGAGEYWLAELQGFAWLRDLRAAGTGDAAERGRAMVLDWLRRHRTIENAVATAWGPEALGRRLSAWLAHSAFLLEGADDEFARRFHKGLELQASHLTRTARNAGEGLPRLIAARGLIESGLCLADGERRIAQGLKLVEAALAKQGAGNGNRLGRTRRRTSRRSGASPGCARRWRKAGTRRRRRSRRDWPDRVGAPPVAPRRRRARLVQRRGRGRTRPHRSRAQPGGGGRHQRPARCMAPIPASRESRAGTPP